MNSKAFFKSNLFFILLIFALAAVNIFLKFSFFELVPSTDSHEYIEAGKFFTADASVSPKPHRLLKPLAPAFMALIAKVNGLDMADALLIEAVIFYFAFASAAYFLFKNFFGDKILAFFGAAVFISGYPVLKYGLDLMTETGAWFFYALGILLTLLFFRKPSYRNLLLAVFVSIFGFYWKEYSALNFVLLGLVVIFHPALKWPEKIKKFALIVALALALILPWQIYVFQKFNYSFFNWLGGGSSFVRTVEYDFFHIAKSLFGTVILAWLLALFGLKSWRDFDGGQKFLLKLLIPVPFIFLFWGAVSSRLYYVVAPAAIILALAGLKNLSKSRVLQAAIVFLIILANYIWLLLNSQTQILS